MLVVAVAESADAVTTGPARSSGATFPASCLSAPLIDSPSGPLIRKSATLSRLDAVTTESRGIETVEFVFWRVPCDGGRSALLVQVVRPPSASALTAVQWPFSYGLLVSQGTHTGSARLALEPNTQYSSILPGALIYSSLTLVFENVPTEGAFLDVQAPTALPPSVARGVPFDFNQALQVRLPDRAAFDLDPQPPPIIVDIPAYDRSQYPDAALALPISGYSAGSYFDPAHSGEGLLIEVGDDLGPAVPRRRYIAAAWFTYDANGRPYWIYGSATFATGDRVAAISMISLSGGGFAGNFGAAAMQAPWGTLTVSFPDCVSTRFVFAARGDLPPSVPAGSGERTWARLTQENGLACR